MNGLATAVEAEYEDYYPNEEPYDWEEEYPREG